MMRSAELLVSPVSVRGCESPLCEQVLPCSVLCGLPFRIVQLAKSNRTSWKGYALELTIFVVSITRAVSLPKVVGVPDPEVVTSVTFSSVVTAYNLNPWGNFGDETVTVVEYKLFVAKLYESLREFGHGSKAEKAGVEVSLSPLRSTDGQLLPHKTFVAMFDASKIQVGKWVPADGCAVRGTGSLSGVELFVVETLPAAKTGQPRNVSLTFRGWPSCFNALSVTRLHRWACSPQQGSPSRIRGLPQRQLRNPEWNQTRFPQLRSRSATGKGSGHLHPPHPRGKDPGGYSHPQDASC